MAGAQHISEAISSLRSRNNEVAYTLFNTGSDEHYDPNGEIAAAQNVYLTQSLMRAPRNDVTLGLNVTAGFTQHKLYNY